MSAELNAIRKEFPVFEGDSAQRLGYLDSAASAQKPRQVIDRMSEFMSHEYANIARGAYQLSAHASEAYEGTREKVARFIGAPDSAEVIFTRGTTESLNLVSASLAETLNGGDGIVLSLLEHHSNIVPWQLAEARRGLKVYFSPLTAHAGLDYGKLYELIERVKPRVVSITHLSNAFGTPVRISEVAAVAHRAGAVLVVDCAQSIVHQRINVAQLGADFIAFSGHKLYGPSGVGVLWGRRELLEKLPPYQGGGGMIGYVSTEGTTWAALPQRFEAGTPAIAEVVGLGAAIDFVNSIGADRIAAHEAEMFDYAWNTLKKIPGVTLYGPRNAGEQQLSIISFSVDGIHPHDLATVLDQHQVQIRAGHHCAMPALSALGLPATARISFGVYSQPQDIDQLAAGVKAAQKLFS